MDDETLRFVTGDQGTLDAPAIRQPLAPLAERWARFEPWWHRIRHTGFSQCLVEGWRAAYGISGLDASTVGQISDAIRAGRRPGHYAEVLKGMANIRISLMQMGGPFGEPIDDVDADLFVPVPRLNRLTMLRSRDDLTDLEREYGEEVDSVGGALRDVESQRAAGGQAVAELPPRDGFRGAGSRRCSHHLRGPARRSIRRA
jgi:hypothetical protein